MNKQKMTFLVHRIAGENNLSFNTALVYFFLEAVLKRIASSQTEQFIFKGGFILSNIIGISQRTTVDMDVLLKNYTMEQKPLRQLFDEILDENIEDGVVCKVESIEPIREQDEYGGFRIKILCQLENVKQVIPLDIATGDPVTPAPISYEYKALFDDRKIPLLCYNLETILAEKLHTIFVRDIANSRSKDFYDVFILMKLRLGEIDKDKLSDACRNTFKYRQTPMNADELNNAITRIEENSLMENRWNTYTKANNYARDISFRQAMDACKQLVNMLEVEVV